MMQGKKIFYVLLLAGIMSGCVQQESTLPPIENTEPPSVQPETKSPSTKTDNSSSESPDGDSEADPGLIHASDEEIAAAREGVVAMMEIWVQGTNMDQQTWEKQLRSTLAPEAVDISLEVWAHKVPDTRIENITVIRADSESATFLVETDTYSYHVTALRQPDNIWLVSDKRLATE